MFLEFVFTVVQVQKLLDDRTAGSGSLTEPELGPFSALCRDLDTAARSLLPDPLHDTGRDMMRMDVNGHSVASLFAIV